MDIYLPDFKYADAVIAETYSKATGYPDIAKVAIKEMHRQVGDLVLDDRGLTLRGLLVRHLVLPGGFAGTAEVMKFIAEYLSLDTYVNVMDQYRPCYQAFSHPPLDRRVTTGEFEEAIRLTKATGPIVYTMIGLELRSRGSRRYDGGRPRWGALE